MGRLESFLLSGYRENLDVPWIDRAHDYQRVFSYGFGGAAVLLLGVEAWEGPVVVAACVTMVLLAVRRLVSGTRPPPFPLALIDLVAATVLVAVATASPLVTLLASMIVAFALLATFRVAVLPGVGVAVTVGLAGVTLATTVQPADGSSINSTLAAFVMVALFLAVAVLILAFFGSHSKKLQQSLVSREAELSTVLSVTPVVLATIARDGTVSAVAGVDSDWLGRSGEAVPPPVMPIVELAMAGSRAVDDVRVAGRTFNVTCLPGPRRSVLLTAYDITDREQTRERLEELLMSKDGFVAAISHELRTPLTAVLGFAEEARRMASHDDPVRSMLDVIADQSAEMSAIIEDLLVAARADQGIITVLENDLDLATEAGAVLASLRGRLVADPTLHLEPAPATGDPVRIRQIIRNLITNADRYGGRVVQIRTGVVEGQSVLEVADDGAEIEEELRERIFEPYHSSGPVRGEPAAMGLGLAVSRRLAVLMGGGLTYAHTDGWSVFRLVFTARVDASAEAMVAGRSS